MLHSKDFSSLASPTPSVREVGLATIFGDELDGAGRIFEKASIWLEARDAANPRG